MKKIIGIVGYGIIGHAVENLFISKGLKCIIYDPNVQQYVSENNFVYSDLEFMQKQMRHMDHCDIIFICVPTPHDKYNGLDMSIVEETIKTFNPYVFVICSALQPGTANRLAKKHNKNIVVQPEYFGETTAHPMVNLQEQPFLILGGEDIYVTKVIRLYQKVYNANIKIRKVSCLEAEIIKLSENRAIAYKVAQCQELYDACEKSNVDYETIRQAVYGDDPRFNLWWTWIYEEARGFNSKCIPKDVYGWYAWAKEVGIEPELTHSLLKYNNKLITKNDKK